MTRMEKKKEMFEKRLQAEARPYRLRIFVFISGACLMALELAGSRILAPYFGNTIFTWGSLLSVFMISLSTGYYFGGKLADRKPSFVTLFFIGMGIALSLLMVPYVSLTFIYVASKAELGPRIEPLLSSILIFFVPSTLMGMVSPFAVKLESRSLSQVGGVAGGLYALSTVGSIFGTIMTAFFLIPTIGVRAILLAIGCLMLVTSAVLLPRGRKEIAQIGVPTLFFAAIMGYGMLTLGAPAPGKNVLFEKETAYSNIKVHRDTSGRIATVQLLFDGVVETRIREIPPHYPSDCEYTHMIQLGRVFNAYPQRVLVVGLGGGVVPRDFKRDVPDCEVDAVEIDPEVIEVAEKFFRFEQKDGVRAYADDGRRFLKRRCPEKKYDYIVLDAYSISGQVPFHLLTLEFMQEIKSHLEPGGVVVSNIISAVTGEKSRLLQSEYKVFTQVFGQVYVFYNYGNLDAVQNTMLIGVDSATRKTPEEIHRIAEDMVAAGTTSAENFIEWSLNLKDDFRPGPHAILLTDDYVPSETIQPERGVRLAPF